VLEGVEQSLFSDPIERERRVILLTSRSKSLLDLLRDNKVETTPAAQGGRRASPSR
jgi:hypothetical protein